MTTDNPFIVKRERYGRPDHYFDSGAFASALATELGYPLTVREEGEWSTAYIDCGDGLILYVNQVWGKLGRANISGTVAGEAVLSHYERTRLESVTVDTSRPMATLAKDVTKRLIDPSRPKVAEGQNKVAERLSETSQLKATIADLRASFPALSIRDPEPNATTASIYLNNSNGYLSGTLYSDGHMTFERVRVEGAEGARKLIALVANGATG
ncbi:hypothetical protein CYK37_30180 [Mesorhizobium loti]|nr:hypothetical protein [Mesorhizobium loti]PLP55559.1 hypothetical protein CYK37_30180 [Mesorhizobium loti]